MKPFLKLRRLQDVDLRQKRVLVRVDFNVPMENGRVSDASRIKATLPTLNYLIEQKAKIVLISHLGRPKEGEHGRFSLMPVAAVLKQLLGREILFSENCVGPQALEKVKELGSGEVCLLENLRFYPQEEANDAEFAKALSQYGEVFVQEAFGSLHRAHASTEGIPKHLPGAIGFLVQRELEFLERVVNNPERPFLAIIGGAKVSDKILVLRRLMDRVDMLIIGGGMAYTFLEAQGVNIGNSLLEKDRLREAQEIIERAYSRRVDFLLPADHVMVEKIDPNAKIEISQAMGLRSGMIGVDIGPNSVEIFEDRIEKAKTIFWNGPMGIFEMPPFSKGSVAIAKAVAAATERGAVTIVGGGDSLALLTQSRLRDQITHCSTGGGASLELLEGKVLPGLAALAYS